MMRNHLSILLTLTAITALPIMGQTPPANDTGALERQMLNQTSTRQDLLDLGRRYTEAGRYYEASKIADRLLAENGDDAEAAALKKVAAEGLKQYEEKRLAEAEERTRSGSASDADRLALADAYFEAGRYLTAADAYEKLPASLKSSEVELRHARALAWGGQTDDAERVYSAILAQDHDPALELEYGRTLSWMGASKLAVERLSSYYERYPTEEAVIALANARAWNGDREGAKALLETWNAAHPNSPAAARLLSDISTSPELRLELLDRTIQVEPYNLALRMERARLLIDAKRYAEALKTIDFIEEHSKSRVEGLAALKEEATQKKKEELAQMKARLAGLKESDDPDQLLQLAKGYTALEDYPHAIRLYDRYLAARPDDVNARIQYARILGWDRRYAASEKQYLKILIDNPDRADLRLEYAQILAYNEQYVPAIRTFHSLTDISTNPRAHLYSDVPEKAHFNLGQIYRWYGWNEHAVSEQNSAIALDSTYSPAREELDLARHLRPASVMNGTYSFAEDSARFRLERYDLTGEKWTSQRTALDLIVGHHIFERFSDDVSANVFGVGGQYRWQDRWRARGNVGANFYDSGLGTRPFWNLGAEWLPSIQSRAALDYGHYDLVYDVFTVESLRQKPISIDDLRAHYDYKTGGFWSALADASYGRISDDNNRFAGHGLLTFRVLKSPFVAIKGDYRYLSYDFRTNRYWSPPEYHSVAGVLQVGDNIRNRVFWDVEAKYGRSYEGSQTSDIRAYEGRITVPINDALDLVGSYGDGKSGRIDSVFGGEQFVNYWQRHWYAGIRIKRLFRNEERHPGRNDYYFDDRQLEQSPVLPPLGERR